MTVAKLLGLAVAAVLVAPLMNLSFASEPMLDFPTFLPGTYVEVYTRAQPDTQVILKGSQLTQLGNRYFIVGTRVTFHAKEVVGRPPKKIEKAEKGTAWVPLDDVLKLSIF